MDSYIVSISQWLQERVFRVHSFAPEKCIFMMFIALLNVSTSSLVKPSAICVTVFGRHDISIRSSTATHPHIWCTTSLTSESVRTRPRSPSLASRIRPRSVRTCYTCHRWSTTRRTDSRNPRETRKRRSSLRQRGSYHHTHRNKSPWPSSYVTERRGYNVSQVSCLSLKVDVENPHCESCCDLQIQRVYGLRGSLGDPHTRTQAVRNSSSMTLQR